MLSSKRRIIDIFVNIVIVFTTFWAVLLYFIGEPDILGSHGVQCFKYFTTDSNILAAVASLIYLIFQIPKKPMPKWVVVFKFIGTVAASITLLTVVFFLAPMGALRGNGLKTVLLFFKGNVFVLHLSTPVLSILSTLFLEQEDAIIKKQALLGAIPVVVYSFVYLTMVVFFRIWTDWYGFTFGGRNYLAPVVMIVMYAFATGLSLVEYKIKQKFSKQ